MEFTVTSVTVVVIVIRQYSIVISLKLPNGISHLKFKVSSLSKCEKLHFTMPKDSVASG